MGEQRVERRVLLPAEPAEVWAALTQGEQLSGWFGCEVEMEPRPGGRVTVTGKEGVQRALIEDVEPERRLSFRWLPGMRGTPRTRVEFTLEPHPNGTLLTVVEAPLWHGRLHRARMLEASA